MSAATTPELTMGVEEKLDRMAAQLDELTAEIRRQREQRDAFAELTHDLAPVARQAMASVSAELDELSRDVTVEDLARFGKRMAIALPTLDKLLAQLEAVAALAGDASELAGPAMTSLTDRLADLEERGYFGFARRGAGVVDRIVTSFSEEDVEALGDNVVLILETVKEMTQPEIMSMLQRTAHLVNEPGAEPGQPPSLLGLIKDMRDPDVRRGLARLLTLLRSMGDTTPTGDPSTQTTAPTKE